MTPAVVDAARLSAARPPRGSVGIVALGQAGFALLSRDDIVLIDPFLSPRPDRMADAVVDPRDLLGVSAVLATHEHGDHLDLPAWVSIAAASPTARFIVPEPLTGLVTDAGIPADRVSGARLGRQLHVRGLRVTPVPARHAVRIEDGYSLGDPDHRAPRFVGYVAELDGVRLYHAGDTLSDERLVATVRELRPDIALLPINGRDPERERRGVVGNLSPDEAARMARELAVAVAIPMHFDLIRGNLGRPEAFVRAMREHAADTSVWVPDAGASFLWPDRAGSRPATAS